METRTLLLRRKGMKPAHDMHNSLFGDPSIGGHSIGREGMHLGNMLNQLTNNIHTTAESTDSDTY